MQNGVPYSNNPAVDRRLKAPITIDGSIEDNYLTYANVQLVQSLFDEADFDDGFPLRNEIYTYDNFLKAVAKFPNFCGETIIEGQTLEETCKRELASIFAHWGQETGKRSTMMESSGLRPSIGLRKSAAVAQTTQAATTRTEAGQVRAMIGPHSLASSTTAVVPSNFHGTITMVASPQFSLPAPTTTRCTCWRIQTLCTRTASWPWLPASGFT